MLLKKICVSFFLLILSFSVTAQINRPKLVVGLVVDQMRWDYLYRYNDQYGNGGFKRLLKQGFSNENTFIPYLPTYTAVGHTCVYTGSLPSITGIVGNNWFDKSLNRSVYCTEDSTVQTVGSNSNAGKMSPDNLWVTTITDELRLGTNFKSKVIGIALKDRGAILPAGHAANAAYWYDEGKWITSSYYMNNLPGWVNQFNAKDLATAYMNKDWNTLLPINKYSQSTDDDKPYESNIKGEKSVVFPHNLAAIPASSKFDAFKTTPFAATFTFDFAKAAIENEKLGKNTVTDFLAVSISSTDYIGHAFGPNSIEAEDAYLRLDKDIADFLSYLDKTVGMGNYLFFLTADHGAAHVPAFLNEHKIPAGIFDNKDLAKELDEAIVSKFGINKAISTVMNYQVYLNDENLTEQNASEVKKLIIKTLSQKPYILNVFTNREIEAVTMPEPQKQMTINGFNPKRSGDIQFSIKPGYFAGGKKGTTHGLWNPYDSHIPLLWFGWKVKPGKSNRQVFMTDISPTIAAMLHIQMPNGNVGKVIEEVFK
ncbi:MAG: alkaline phosphatase family protein [Ferruginibacter sp.]|nr:alkaline phosphatase family protein [Bacteroidota bacterium]MBX2919225.1 alkaline phosphatase family protein [Ferruginibacter sp.]